MASASRALRFSPVSFLIGSLVTLLVVALGVSVRLTRVAGDAMAPTYVNGDVVLFSALQYWYDRPRRGDVALLHYPLEPAKLLVARLIANEGDTVRILDGRVYLNDRLLKDDYVLTEYRSHDNWGPSIVPQGYYFVLGDHRNTSSDSRHWGPVPRGYVWGRAVGRVWPPRSS